MLRIYPVVMCGGAGTRMWPLSRASKPKQYHSIVTEKTMLLETIQRLDHCQDMDVQAPSFVCAATHEDIIRAECESENIKPHRIVLEPMGRNTAPVAALISQLIVEDDTDALILLLPADHHIADPKEFWCQVSKGIEMTQDGYLMTLGIKPTAPETGFGYIKIGRDCGDDTYLVDAFVEKPDKETAERYLATREYFWNAGMFLFSAQTMIDVFKECAPDILHDTAKAIEQSKTVGTSLYLDAVSFKNCRSESLDYAIMEKTSKVGIIAPVDVGWNDIGSWVAVRDMLSASKPTDKSVVIGDVIQIDCVSSYIRSDGPMVAAIGLDNMIVVASKDAILIVPADRAQDVKKIVAELNEKKRDELI